MSAQLVIVIVAVAVAALYLAARLWRWVRGLRRPEAGCDGCGMHDAAQTPAPKPLARLRRRA